MPISISKRHLLLLLLFLQLTKSNSANPNPSDKLTHIRFYFHDIIRGRNRTAVRVTKPAVASPAAFGMITVMDDPLTEGPDPKSRLVGRAQGFYAAADQNELSLLMAMNLAFTAGEYNGSVLSVLGRNQPFYPVREMPVIGGSGAFRFARGYAEARTHSFSRDVAVVEYNVYLMHI
ncbi:hypothetical protein KFK09_024565 [Dendrobium nobile]|uniref:Dirigent protein n=1 Tax=Dendrobium nobile TaxID=94219 RepID=A0A8T3AEC9_DENNO|nr:hypothetical protein KFK09_024565 [Dendrobium nobile]